MRTVAQALSPSSQPETGHQARRDATATPGSPTPRTGREGNRKCPPSILRLSRPEHCGHGAEPQRTSRHVRFHEPLEVAVHYIAGREPTAMAKASGWPSAPGVPLLLRLSVCALLLLALALYCGLEDLRAQLHVLVLHLRQAALACWHCLLQL
ncbi:nutritionally-regulated adipose and cardiac enriched protein homolog isoform X2 [Rhinolophus sinicus]|uniref:nutritionally-regulated adipose and cardiac enriched protein homolog isoform X2 n=1 Tax=Rhinolophus sinicus TaxID=89399 RepID=UPI003D78E4CE